MSRSSDPVEVESLLSHRRWIRGLARSLLRDENLVDDVEQETWMTAMRSRPAQGPRIRGWLRRVVRSRAIDLRRAQARRELREEAVAAQRPAAAAAHLVDQADMQRAVAQSVGDLSEPYRSTVLLRYFEELSPREIADRLDVPQATVRTRLHRAHEMLRVRLESEFGGGRRDWRGSLALLAVPPSRWATPAAAGLSTGGIVMTFVQKCVVVGALLLIGAALIGYGIHEWDFAEDSHDLGEADRGGGADDLDPDGAAALEGRSDGGELSAGDAGGDNADRGSPATEPAQRTPATHLLRGSVRGVEKNAVAETKVAVFVLREYGWVDTDIEPFRGEVRADGSYEVDLSGVFQMESVPNNLRVRFDHPDYVVAKPTLLTSSGRTKTGRPTEFRVDVTLKRATVVAGRVLRPDGNPVVGGTVALLVRHDGRFRLNDVQEPKAAEKSKTEADGTFRLRTDRTGEYVLAALTQDLLPASRIMAVEHGVAPDPVEIVMQAGLSIRGRVIVNGRPVADAQVEAYAPDPAFEFQIDHHDLVWRDERLVPGDQKATTDATGAYEIKALDEPLRRTKVSRVKGLPIWYPLLEASKRVVQPGSDGVDFEIEGAHVEVRVQSGEQRLEGARATVLSPGKEHGDAYQQSDDEGRVRFILPPDAALRLSVSHEGYKTVEREFRTLGVRTQSEEIVDLGPSLSGTLVLTLRDPKGKPIRNAEIRVTKEDDGFGFGFNDPMTSEIGVYRLEHLEVGESLLLVRPGRKAGLEFTSHFLPIRERIQLDLGKETMLSLTAELGGRLRVTVRDEAGQLIGASATLRDERGQKRRVMYVTQGEGFATMSSGGPGTASVSRVEPALEPGEYHMELSANDRETKRVSVTVRAGETHDIEVTLRKL